MARFTISAFADEAASSLEDQLDFLERCNISHIEMRKVDDRQLVDHSLAETEAIRRRLDKRGFRVSAVGSPLGKIAISDDFKPHLALFRHTLEIARILDTAFIRMFSFYIPEGEDPARWRGEVISRWEQFLEAAGDRPVTLVHENEKRIYGDTAARCLDLLEALGGRAGLAFDPANFIQCDEEPYPAAFEMLRKHITYLHVKDARAADRRVVPAGRGAGRWPALIGSLRDDGFSGFLSLEPHLGSYDELADLAPDSPWRTLADPRKRKFAVAVEALRAVLAEAGAA